MKLRVVYALIASMWIIAAVLLFLTRLLAFPYARIVWPLGYFIPPTGVTGAHTIPCRVFSNYFSPCHLWNLQEGSSKETTYISIAITNTASISS